MFASLGELRWRNAFKVCAAYVVMTWLLIQVTDIVLPTFSASESVGQTFTLLLILGFPVAVILAWAYEITSQGIKKDPHHPVRGEHRLYQRAETQLGVVDRTERNIRFRSRRNRYG